MGQQIDQPLTSCCGPSASLGVCPGSARQRKPEEQPKREACGVINQENRAAVKSAEVRPLIKRP
jgi:hypothetical protein